MTYTRRGESQSIDTNSEIIWMIVGKYIKALILFFFFLRVEKQFLLKNLEGKSHNSKNTKVEYKKTPWAVQHITLFQVMKNPEKIFSIVNQKHGRYFFKAEENFKR